MGLPEIHYISEKDYLDAERLALDKHEYYQGEIFAMSGASLPHNKIFSNTFSDIFTKLKGKKCQSFGSDLRIHIPKNTLYTYPDISIICGEIETTDDKFDTITNPSVIIEILSRFLTGVHLDRLGTHFSRKIYSEFRQQLAIDGVQKP